MICIQFKFYIYVKMYFRKSFKFLIGTSDHIDKLKIQMIFFRLEIYYNVLFNFLLSFRINKWVSNIKSILCCDASPIKLFSCDISPKLNLNVKISKINNVRKMENFPKNGKFIGKFNKYPSLPETCSTAFSTFLLTLLSIFLFLCTAWVFHIFVKM